MKHIMITLIGDEANFLRHLLEKTRTDYKLTVEYTTKPFTEYQTFEFYLTMSQITKFNNCFESGLYDTRLK